MAISTSLPATGNHQVSARWRWAGYWLATLPVVAELAVGGLWDVTRLQAVRDLVTHLGYPTYFLVLLGTWKVLGAVALLAPGLPLLKEWAYAGSFFAYSGAIVSHLITGYSLSELALLIPLTALTIVSWALRPPGRRLKCQSSARRGMLGLTRGRNDGESR
jgi:hypothetical protein